jgi:hypothetical protein
VAHLAGVSGSVSAAPRKAAVPLGRVAAAEECRGARAFLAAEQRASKLMDAIDRSPLWPLGSSNTPLPFCAPGCRNRPQKTPLNLTVARAGLADASQTCGNSAGGQRRLRERVPDITFWHSITSPAPRCNPPRLCLFLAPIEFMPTMEES